MPRFIYLIIAVSILFCGCSPIKQEQKPEDGYTLSSPAKTVYNPQENDNLMMHMIRPDTLNPLETGFSSNRDLFSLVYDSLVAVNSDFSLDFRLAERVEAKEDSTVFSVKLRENVKWHDGTPFDAYDVKHTVNVILDLGEENAYYGNVKNIDRIDVRDSDNLEISLTESNSGFAYLLTFPVIKDEAEFSPVGTGMYELVKTDSMSEYGLVRNENYYGEKPEIESISVSVLPDIESAANSFKMNITDVSFVKSTDASKYSESDGVKSIDVNSSKYSFLALSYDNALLKDSGVKRVLKELLVTDKIEKDLLPSRAVIADSPVHPNAYFAIEREEKESPGTKKLLEENGCVAAENGYCYKKIDDRSYQLAFVLLINADNPTRVIVGEYIKSTLEACGISVRVVKAGRDEYREKFFAGNYDLALCETEISPDYDLSFLLKSGGSLNTGKYSSEYTDALLSEVKNAENDKKRTESLKNLQEAFDAELPHIPLYFSVDKLICGSEKFEEISAAHMGNGYLDADKWKLK